MRWCCNTHLSSDTGVCVQPILNLHVAKQINENVSLSGKKKNNPCCPITCVIIGIEAPFDVGNLSLTRCNLQSQDVNVVLGPFGCLELTRCSLWSLQFATTVPIVSVGLFALV